MLKFGIVTAINPLTAKARVEFADDNILSYWLPILQKKTLKDKFYSIVDVGEQVACLMDENSEDGVILGSIYTSLDEVPGISKDQHIAKFEDGSFIEYVICDDVIGYYYSPAKSKYIATRCAQVKYSLKNKNIHIIPVKDFE